MEPPWGGAIQGPIQGSLRYRSFGPYGTLQGVRALPTTAELEASRARLVAAADEARRRLERDLHDGAQQHLVSAALTLKQAEARARGTAAEPLVADALEQLRRALTALRDLARGIHPSVLSERGLAAALQDLAARSPVPVELHVAGERVRPAVEAAIYFTVAEALTNVAKHAHATRVKVSVEVAGGELVAEIADDGIGGASLVSGSGLQGLADRLDAVDGTFAIDSPCGAGTRIRARVLLSAAASDGLLARHPVLQGA
jgi:signal transduction histidine kinase